MRSVFFFLPMLGLSWSLGLNGAELTLREHMAAIGQLKQKIEALVKQTSGYPEAADSTRAMRGHFIEGIALSPSSFAALPPEERDSEVVFYHQTMSRAIYLSASLEEAIIARDYIPQSGSREQDIQNLLRELNKLMRMAHDRFKTVSPPETN